MIKPRRNRKAFLEGAPSALLAVYDNGGETFDRYTALYGEHLWDARYPHMLQARGMSAHPNHPQGFGQWCELPRSLPRTRLGRPVRFLDLPEDVRRCIEWDCKP